MLRRDDASPRRGCGPRGADLILSERLPPAHWTLRLIGRAALVWALGRGLLAVVALMLRVPPGSVLRASPVTGGVIALVVGSVLLLDLKRRGGELLLGNPGVSSTTVVAVGTATAVVGEIVLAVTVRAGAAWMG